jgi:hypothetical protein
LRTEASDADDEEEEEEEGEDEEGVLAEGPDFELDGVLLLLLLLVQLDGME